MSRCQTNPAMMAALGETRPAVRNLERLPTSLARWEWAVTSRYYNVVTLLQSLTSGPTHVLG